MKPQLEEYMEEDEHSKKGGFYTICNIYYDTPENEIIRKSIEKPAYKEKLRLRSYGVVGRKDRVYLEVKKKFNGCVNKRRTPIILEDAYLYLETKQKPKEKTQMNAQVLNEIDSIVQRYNDLQPSLFLSYDRIALFGIEDKDFRITFDTNIRTRRYDLGLDIGIYGDLLLQKGQWIMEAKMNNTAPLWFAKLLSRYQIYPVSYSKYGSEYTNRVLSGSRNITKDYKKMCV
jgi:SPX domain protein involved in polyphosphate accumulation